MNVHGYTRINQTPLTKINERIIVLRKSKSILEELLVHTDNDFAYAAMCLSIKKINDEISALTHQS